jgi:hypothetical protein
MMTRLRASLLVQTLGMVACAQIIGIEDVPTPDRMDSGSTPDTGGDATGGDSGGALDDGGVRDASGDDRSLADVSSPGVDAAAVDSTAPEAGSADAGVDAAGFVCAPTWNTANLNCNSCGVANCCAVLGSCQALDDTGLSRCAELVTCITGYTGSAPGLGEMNCTQDQKSTSSEIAAADAVLLCVRTACGGSGACHGL